MEKQGQGQGEVVSGHGSQGHGSQCKPTVPADTSRVHKKGVERVENVVKVDELIVGLVGPVIKVVAVNLARCWRALGHRIVERCAGWTTVGNQMRQGTTVP